MPGCAAIASGTQAHKLFLMVMACIYAPLMVAACRRFHNPYELWRRQSCATDLCLALTATNDTSSRRVQSNVNN
ncbi:hypothetical protein V8C26DRAFT_405495 [Trichoderma gracile]